MQVFFDLDPAVYMAAFASQRSVYSAVWEDDKGELSEKYFEDGLQAREFVKENPKAEVSKDVLVKPVGFARQAAKTIVNVALHKIGRKFDEEVSPQFFLSGKGNFREGLATIAEYKGNRKELKKPEHYDQVRDYFVEAHGAYVIDGTEADDEVSIRAWEAYRMTDEPYVVATIDKDLDQIPGWHYDYKSHVFYEVDPLDAELFFYSQVLAGDATDNIKGCYRVGVVKARKMVDDWFIEAISSKNPAAWRARVWRGIVDAYEGSRIRYPDKHPTFLTPEEEALETARLVFLQTRRGEIWKPES